MGAGASTADKAELQRAYAAWQAALAGSGSETLAPDVFLQLLAREAPGLHSKATADGSGHAVCCRVVCFAEA